jgi:hypothetical protein
VPISWRAHDGSDYLDPAWAEREKQRYPRDAALIEATVEMFKTGRIAYSAFIELDESNPGAEGLLDISIRADGAPRDGLRSNALASVDRQPVSVRPGTSAQEVALPIGPAVRLDWSFDLTQADGTSEIGSVRSYWFLDGTSKVVVQLTTYGSQPAAIASFEGAVQTFRWATEVVRSGAPA